MMHSYIKSIDFQQDSKPFHEHQLALLNNTNVMIKLDAKMVLSLLIRPRISFQ